MARSSHHNLLTHLRPYLSDTDLEAVLDGSADSRYSKVKRMLAQGKMLHIRRGLYFLQNSQHVHPFELAQHIYAPSYISLESALAYHQLIPEAVHTITSVCTKRSKEFHTPLGLFSYARLPLENFYTEVELVIENNGQFLIAKPWKALCDYVYCSQKKWDDFAPVLASLRIDPDDLPAPRDQEIDILDEYYQNKRISRFLKTIARES